MRFFSHNKPPYFLRRLFFLCVVLALFAGCTTANRSRTGQGGGSGLILQPPAETVVFYNKTPLTVHLVRGSGRVDVVSIAPGSSAYIPNEFEAAEDYYPLFDIPMTASFSLSRLRPEDPNFYYRVDNYAARQYIDIRVPSLSDNSAYIIFTNNSRSGGIALSRNDEGAYRMTGINYPDAKSNINVGETLVFRENPRDLRRLRINPSNISFGEMTYRGGYVYSFDFDGSDVSLTDVRPLRRMGELAWAEPMRHASGPMPLVAAGGEIHAFVSGNDGLFLHTFDSAGNADDPVQCGDGFELTFSARAGNDFFVTGYNKSNAPTPVLRIYGADGQARRILPPSVRREYKSAFFLSAVQKDNFWLAVGAADSGANTINTYPAYARMVRNTGSSLAVEWEIGGKEFDEASGRVKCGEIRSAVYNSARDRWLLAGKNLEFNSMRNLVTGSYIAVITGAGKIEKINFFTGMSFNTILSDSGGNYYVAGEEQNGNAVSAIVIKYNADGREIWRSVSQPASNSFYQTAVLDTENNRIALAGTMRARTGGGTGGAPFIEAVNTETGELLWRENLTDLDHAGTSLVTSIVPAPDYGFALTLSGVTNDSFSGPFILARVNARGKYLN